MLLGVGELVSVLSWLLDRVSEGDWVTLRVADPDCVATWLRLVDTVPVCVVLGLCVAVWLPVRVDVSEANWVAL